MKERILCVDDDKIILFSFERYLGSQFAVTSASTAEQALPLLRTDQPFAVILADMVMPGMDGVEFLARAAQIAPDSTRIMLSGDEDKQTAVDAINEGRIFRFLTKPCSAEKLMATIKAGVKQHQLVVAERELLEKTLRGSLNLLSELLAVKEPGAFGRGQKVRDYLKALAPSLKLDSTWELEAAALLSKIGLMTMPPSLMKKLQAGVSLTSGEADMLTRVPEIGYKLLSNIPRLEPVAEIVQYQHKNFDGTGFPKDSVSGEKISRGSRLLRILTDLAEAEASGVSPAVALDRMKQQPGIYDQNLVELVYTGLVSQPLPSGSRSLRLNELSLGDVALAPIETNDGLLIAPAGATITAAILERLYNFAELIGLKEPIHVTRPEPVK